MAKSAPKKAAAPAKKAVPKKATSTKAAPAKAKATPAKAAATSAKKAPARAVRPTPPAKRTKQAAGKQATRKAPAAPKAAPAPRSAPAAKSAPAPKAAASRSPAEATTKSAKPTKKVASVYDAKFLDAQRNLLLEERAKLVGQAEHLDAEAAALMEDLDPGDVQFDDESGEGDTLVVERERDLALAGQARQTVIEIDDALRRIDEGTYGLSVISGKAIPKERLRAIPWATELVEEKVGGLGSRR
jgi:RNA polymerase-binding transcription factor DksA